MNKELVVLRYLLLLMLVSFDTVAKTHELKIGFSNSLSPYVTDRALGIGNGIEPDLVEQLYNTMAIKPQFSYMKTGLLVGELNNKLIDAAIYLERPDLATFFNRTMYYSAPLIEFENVAISLADKQYKLNTPQDLIGKKVAAFRGASRRLGRDFNASLKVKSSVYREYKGLHTLIKLLYKRRYDVIIIERRMFEFWLKYTNAKSKKKINTQEAIQFHQLFPTIARRVVFDKEEEKNKFNRALAEFKKTDDYQNTIDFYVKKKPAQ